MLFEASGTSEERVRVSFGTIRFLHDLGFGFFEIDQIEARGATTIDRLTHRKQMPRWQDALFNVVTRRPTASHR